MDIPQELGERFERGEEIVRRPSCIVFRGNDRTLNREVAIKVYIDQPNGDAAIIAAFENEVALLRAASHSALVPIIAGGESGGVFYIAMELINGPRLRETLKEKGGPLDIEQAVGYASELAAAVGEIHEQKTIHGHLDTRGILFKGKHLCVAGYYPMTIDRISKNVTMADGRMTIDPLYIAPEQIEKPESADGRADIYALSVMLFEMLTGQRPFSSKNPLHTAMMRLTEKPPSPMKFNKEVPPLLDAAVLKGLSKDPAQRFQSVSEFIDTLSGVRKRSTVETESAVAGSAPERLSGTETIAVSMSSESIQQMLRSHEAKTAAPSAPPPSRDAGVTGTLTGMPTVSGAEGRLDTSATVMSLDVSKALRGNFIFLDGPKQGSRYLVDKPQMIIGSDPTCDISLSEKSVPRRCALVVLRDGDYFAESLSGKDLRINGQEVEADGDGVKLKRGDVLNIGNFSLRFIAPGEVFTLQSEVADRVIDRPKSRWPALILSGLAAIVVVCGGMIYVYRQQEKAQQYAEQQQKKGEQREREQLIARLLQEGDEFYKAGAYSEPVGANAKEKFQKVLELSKDNPFAKRRLDEIKEREVKLTEERARREQFKFEIARLLQDGERFFKNGEYISPPGKNARDMYRQVLDRDPSNQVAKQRIAEIEKILGDVLGRVGGLLKEARVHIDAGRYVLPKGENAYDVLQEVLRVDPTNEEARNDLLEMAARSVFEGDEAKARIQPKVMKQKYLTAKALGVDPDFIDQRMQGIELMGRAKSSVIIVNRNQGKDTCKKNPDPRFINCEELMRRVASLSLNQKTEDAGTATAGRQLRELENAPEEVR